MAKQNKTHFIFPEAQSTVLPDPSEFFSSTLLSKPLPTNSFFQNFVLKNGDQPEYIHPYLIKSSNSSLSLSYPSRQVSSAVIYQVFNADLTISSKQGSSGKHVISSYSDLSVTLDIPSSNLSFLLVRGSPFLTVSVTQPTPLSITTIHSILSFSSNNTHTKHTFQFNNGQTWILYASSPISLSHTLSEITSHAFSGIVRIALLPDSDSKHEAVLDKFSSCYPVSGEAKFREPFCVEYKWEKKGSGDLLLLAHPLHLQLLSNADNDVTVLEDFKYGSIDGDVVGVVGNSWVLKTDPVFVTWQSTNGVKEESHDEIVSALSNDVDGLNSSSITETRSYFYGKLVARAARLALIAEELCYPDVIPMVVRFLKETIEPWLEGTLKGNGFLHDKKWGGIITQQGSNDGGGDFGFGIYNDHHYHLGYFLYGIAVVTKFDEGWGRKYKAEAYSLVQDFMNLDTKSNSNYTRLRCFDPYVLHSWAGGLTEFTDGRNQESTSEAVCAYYSAALMGLAYGDAHLVSLGSTLTALEILGTKMWWHVEEKGTLYEEEFTEENRIMGVLWSNKRDTGLWFAPAEWKECRLGIQLLPLVPISEAIFSNAEFVKQLVEWTLPALNRDGVGEGWKGFVYALEGIYDHESALHKIRNLTGFDGGNSLTNLLWWIHSRG
ncbi:probable endo-1,3(4)-beta-glucanase ARB_01444 [Vigna unguiculata]|uniref:probable endo-1,3(4)-beta-glucanase ARB_01444 n=1 Tax=Vigna unguiculata TaxID=3917 RepID=UPI001016A572|nr:probable endo-1,3(4)-beta-glucanase ARB_01444 [Vigna unguiculata]